MLLVLLLVLLLKQQFDYWSYKTAADVKSTDIKNRTYCFFNDMINLKNFASNLLKIDKRSHKNINIYYTGYITIKKIDDYENIYSVNPLYLIVNHANSYLEEKKWKEIFGCRWCYRQHKEVLIKYTELWNGIKNEIKAINGGKEIAYDRNFMSIKFNSDDYFPLNKPLKFHAMTIVVRSVF